MSIPRLSGMILTSEGKRADQRYMFAPNLRIGDIIRVRVAKTKDDPEGRVETYKAERFYPDFALCRKQGNGKYLSCIRYFDIANTPGYRIVTSN